MSISLTPGATLLVATTNTGKLREIQRLLAGLPLDIQALPADTNIAAPEETGATFAENARLKAEYYAKATGMLTVAEDSGLEIDALDGAPGVLSARYPGADYAERFRNLFAALNARGATTADRRSARFVCALALAVGRPGGAGDHRADPADAHAHTHAGPDAIAFEARGTIEGQITNEPSGSEGFGYDPIFFYPPYGKTLAEVTIDEKARVSHRGAAFRQLRAFLEQQLSA